MSAAQKPLSHREWCLAFIHGFMDIESMTFEPHDVQPRVGDLVLLKSAPPSLWSISYLTDFCPLVSEGRQYDTQWTLRAVGTDELCDWSNVGFRIFRRRGGGEDREFTGVFHDERLKMNGDQFQFWQDWTAEGRKADLYILLQTMPRFEGKRAVCGWRIQFGFHETLTPPAVFDDITKVTRAHMRAAIQRAEEFHKQELDEAKRQREAAHVAVAGIAALVMNVSDKDNKE